VRVIGVTVAVHNDNTDRSCSDALKFVQSRFEENSCHGTSNDFKVMFLLNALSKHMKTTYQIKAQVAIYNMLKGER